MAFLIVSTAGPLGVALVLRLVLRGLLHGRLPRVEAAVERWWIWTPLLTLVVGAWVFLGVVAALALIVAGFVLLQFADERTDVPFRVIRRPPKATPPR